MSSDERDCRRLTENLGKGYFFFRHDASGVLTYVSPSIQDMLGYTPADYLPHFKARMTDDPGNASVARRTEMGLQGERQPPYEVEVLHKDGSARWLEVTEFPMRDRSGRITGLEGIAKDVTEYKRLATALQASERRFKELFAQAPVGVAMIDSHTGRIQELNPMFARIAGRSEEEMRRVDWMSITHPDDIQKDLDQMARMNAGEIPGFRMEKRYLRPGGAVVWIDMTIAPLKIEADAPPHHLCMIQDITERKKLEEALTRAQNLDSLGNLAGGIAHDFNNILTAILGNLSLLHAKLGADGEALALLTEAREACGTAKGLSNELLTFAKGGSPIVQAADLRLVFAQAALFAARGTKTRCVFHFGETPLMVDIDKGLISRVVQNLVLNATQAMPQGGDFTVTAEIVDQEATGNPPRAAGRYVRVTAEDEGLGIKPEALPKIFDPYFSTKGVGRGLGLSICYSIMLKHGGNISAAPRPGAGAVFTLHFPCAAAGAADAPADREKPALGASILIMDDEVSLVRVLKRIVEHLGGEADTVTNGKDALDAYRRAMEAGRPFDAVIMDLTVAGGMGGMEMIGSLLALDPSAKAIVSSGYADDPVMTEFTRRGFSDKLVKPYDIAQASAALRRVLGRS